MEASTTPTEESVASAAEPDGQLLDDLFEHRFSAGRMQRYHRRRGAFFEHWMTFVTVVSLIMATSVAGVLLAAIDNTLLPVLLSLAVTALNLFTLVSGFGRKRELHVQLGQRYGQLRYRLRGDPPSADLLRSALQERASIESDEPHILRLLDTICHNDEIRGQGLGRDHIVPLRWHHRLIAQYWDFDVDKLKKQSDQAS